MDRCGPQPNSRLLLNYGFVDEDNPHDRLTVEVRNVKGEDFSSCIWTILLLIKIRLHEHLLHKYLSSLVISGCVGNQGSFVSKQTNHSAKA